MIDFHCHIDLYPEPNRMIAACIKDGTYVLSVTTTPSAWTGTAALAQGIERIKTAVGLHPQVAGDRHSELSLFDEILPTVRYVGEIGLDGSPELQCSWDKQIHVFEHILKSCRRAGGRIMSIHSRRATKPVLDCLEANRFAGIPVLHWYSGSTTELRRAIDLDCWFSVGPAMVQSKNGRMLMSQMPRDRILTETDGPFAQTDGRPLLPGETGAVISHLANLWGAEQLEIEQLIRDNLKRLLVSL